MSERSWLREVVGELVSSGVLVAVVFASGAVKTLLGTGTAGAALLASAALGLGSGLVLWSFGSLSGAQGNPLVSIVASVLGGQPWRRTVARIVAQVAGAAFAGLLAQRLVPPSAGDAGRAAASGAAADAVAAFGFVLVALGVAHRRDARVPLALGAFATASFWMTGRATLGNPLLSTTVLLVTGHGSPDVVRAAVAAAIGTAAAAVVGRFLFLRARDAASALLFVPGRTA